MNVGDVLIAGERVADQHRVAALGVERTVGLVGDLERGEVDAGIEPQRLVHAEAGNERMRMVGFARAIGGIKHNVEIGVDHLLTTRPAKRNSRHLTRPVASLGRRDRLR
jgi:hypothetical protein